MEIEMPLPVSDQKTVLLHNPRCSKSRATLALLEERGAKFELREYLKEPLTRSELASLVERLGMPVTKWVRKGEDVYKAAGLSSDSSDAAVLDAMVEHPILMERPIVVRGQRAAVGRPPEQVLDIL